MSAEDLAATFEFQSTLPIRGVTAKINKTIFTNLFYLSNFFLLSHKCSNLKHHIPFFH